MNIGKKTAIAGTAPAASAPLQDCGNLCSIAFWKTATINDVKRELDQGANLEARGEGGLTPLHAAASDSETPAVVGLLLNRGANLRERDENGQTLLHMAAANSETPAVVELLLDCGASPKAGDVVGRVPFEYAKENEALANTNAYWRLNEGTY